MSSGTSPDKLSPLVLKPSEAAKALGICERKLWSMTKQGVIPHVRIGSNVRYPCDALRSWLTSQVQGGVADSPG